MPGNRQLTFRDLLALGSMFSFTIGSAIAAMWLLLAEVFHVNLNAPLPGPPAGLPIIAVLLVAGMAAGLVGKYAWLLSMSRWLGRAEITPLIVYGIPRRLSRLDRRILDRFYP